MTHDLFSKGNLANISKIIPIDISVKPGVMEHILIDGDCSHREIELYTALFKEFCDLFSWSYKEMSDIDP